MLLRTEENEWAFNVPVGTVLKVNNKDSHQKYYSTFTVLERIEGFIGYKIRLTYPSGHTSIYEDCTPSTLITWCVPHIVSKVFLDSDWYQ